MYLTLDIGNSRIKFVRWTKDYAVDEQGLVDSYDQIRPLLPDVNAVAWSSTRGDAGPDFSNFSGSVFELTPQSKLPFSSEYTTPQTLGKDRIAGLVGALNVFPGKDVLVMDAGTCLTFDVLTAAKVHKGGSISPGLHMRYQALQQLTGKLPLVQNRDWNNIVGLSTEESILTGVRQGFMAEMDVRIGQFLLQWPFLQIIATGGDAYFLANQPKYRIFAEPLLIHKGLLYCFLNQ